MNIISPKFGRQGIYSQPPIEDPNKNRKRKIFFVVVFAVVAVYLGFKNSFNQENKWQVLSAESTVSFPKGEGKASKGEKKSCLVVEGDTPAKIFSAYGKLDANDTESLLAAAEGVYDFTNVRIGRELRFYFNGEERASRIEYDRDTETMIVAERSGNDFKVHEEKIDYDVSVETAHGTIDNFFYADALEAGLSEPTVLEVGDLFSFSIDFMTEIRQGDEFDFVYEKRKLGEQDAPDGKILAAKFINDGTAHYAYYFEDGYYDNEGHLLERQFLKAPLSYRRITSGFTGARMHPITRVVSAHYQIDYAAPTGTPVVSTARGTVVSAGWETGWGNIVRLRHDNGYTTHYGHLSGFAKGIVSGASVEQGEVVGFVGSTGWSTGPHLDFGMKLNGVPVNPLKLDLPKGQPLPSDKMASFEETKKLYAQELE